MKKIIAVPRRRRTVSNYKPVLDILLNNFDAIKAEVLKSGCWCLPDSVSAQLNRVPELNESCMEPRQPSDLHEMKTIFKEAPFILEKFCALKCQEIAFYLKRHQESKGVESKIHLSFLEIHKKGSNAVRVTTVALKFNEKNLVSHLKKVNQEDYINLVHALQCSDWMNPNDDKLLVHRFSDHEITESFIKKYYMADINYFLTADNVQTSAEQSFWTCFVSSRKVEQDEALVKVLADTVSKDSKEVLIPNLHNDVRAFAQIREAMDQVSYVKNILKNQRLGLGTLLYLPTGYGKTFVMLMAMAQHRRDLEVSQRRPYIVVCPANNVKEAWRSNLDLLEQIEGRKSPLFGDKVSYKLIDKTNDIRDFFDDSDNLKSIHIILITKQMLTNYIELFFNSKKKGSWLSKNEATLKSVGIINENGLILGNEDQWRSRLCNNEQVQSQRGRRPRITELVSRIDLTLSNLRKRADNQINAQVEYEKFLNNVSGMMLDESQFLFSDSKESRGIKPTELVNDISAYYNSRAEKGSLANPLIIAASATPWPNSFDELRQHLQFLAPRYMKQYHALNKFLFSKWNSLENKVDIISTQVTSSDEDLKDLLEKTDNIKNSLFSWIKIFYDLLVLHEPSSPVTNDSSEEFMMIDIKENKSVKDFLQEKSANNVLQMIDDFYSNILSDYFGPDYKLPKRNGNSNSNDKILYTAMEDRYIDERLDPENKVSFSLCVQTLLKNIRENVHSKRAIYLSSFKDALLLKQIVESFFEKEALGPVEIGFFYNDDYVKHQYQGKSGIAINRDRNVNKHAFNNVLKKDDYLYFLKERLSFMDNKKDREAICFVFDFFESIAEPHADDKPLTFPRGFCGTLKLNIQQYVENHDQIPVTSFFSFMKKIIQFQHDSQNKILLFNPDNQPPLLDDFVKFLPDNLNGDNSTEKFNAFREFIDTSVEDEIFQNDWSLSTKIIYSLLYYLHKISISKIFIFGIAGTSGMRIDAHHMYLFSGAWTEGRMTQIRGRSGRVKGDSKALPCEIHVPLSNTYYELFILKYYIIKALYNQFIVAPEVLSSEDILLPLFLAKRCFQIYMQQKQAVIYSELFDIVRGLEERGEDFFGYSPTQKALHIIPKKDKDSLDDRLTRLRTLIAKPEARPPVGLPAGSSLPSNPSSKRHKSSVPPRISAHASAALTDEDTKSLERFLDPNKQTILLMLPSQGKSGPKINGSLKGDLTLGEFMSAVSKGVGENFQVLLVFGLNTKHTPDLDSVSQLEAYIAENKASEEQMLRAPNIWLKLTPFLWHDADRKEGDGTPPHWTNA